MKKLFFLAVFLFAAGVFAESMILTPENCVIKPFQKGATAVYQDGAWIISGPVRIYTKKKIAVDDAKKYRVSAEIRALDGTEPATLCIGFVPFMADDRAVAGMHMWFVEKSYAVLAEAVKPGDTVIKVRPEADSSAWSKPVTDMHVALGAKKDFSDLPNFKLNMLIAKSELKDGVQILTMKRKAAFGAPAGTLIRLHRGGGDAMHAAFNSKKYSDKPLFIAGTATGRITGWNYRKWPVNVPFCRVQVLANWIAPASKVEIRNLKFDILP